MNSPKRHTGPVQVISRWERFKRETVWHPINTDPDDAYRHGPKFWYPIFDLLMISLGVQAFAIGSPLLNRLFPVWFVDSIGAALIIMAIFAIVGAVFPRLYILELFGKLGLTFILGGYAGTVWALSPSEDIGFVVLALVSLVWLLGPRISWLFLRLAEHLAERDRRRRLAKEASQ